MNWTGSDGQWAMAFSLTLCVWQPLLWRPFAVMDRALTHFAHTHGRPTL